MTSKNVSLFFAISFAIMAPALLIQNLLNWTPFSPINVLFSLYVAYRAYTNYKVYNETKSN